MHDLRVMTIEAGINPIDEWVDSFNMKSLRATRAIPRTDAACIGPRAYTLIELVLSLAIATILLMALQSTVMVAARAIPDSRSLGSRIVNGAPPVATFSADLFGALSVSEMTP